eukprot:3849061-Karenia_brevis.AAC.1
MAQQSKARWREGPKGNWILKLKDELRNEISNAQSIKQWRVVTSNTNTLTPCQMVTNTAHGIQELSRSDSSPLPR